MFKALKPCAGVLMAAVVGSGVSGEIFPFLLNHIKQIFKIKTNLNFLFRQNFKLERKRVNKLLRLNCCAAVERGGVWVHPQFPGVGARPVQLLQGGIPRQVGPGYTVTGQHNMDH